MDERLRRAQRDADVGGLEARLRLAGEQERAGVGPAADLEREELRLHELMCRSLTFEPAPPLEWFGGRRFERVRELERVPAADRPLLVVWLFGNVLADQAMHAGFPDAHAALDAAARTPKFGRRGGPNESPFLLLERPVEAVLVDEAALAHELPSCMRLLVRRAAEVLPRACPGVEPRRFFETMLRDADFQRGSALRRDVAEALRHAVDDLLPPSPGRGSGAS